MDIICAFMAILESVKENTIIFSQKVLYGPIYIERKPIDWDPKQVDLYDREADDYEKYDLGTVEDFSILTKEAEMDLDAILEEKNAERGDNSEIEELYIGDEEEISLED